MEVQKLGSMISGTPMPLLLSDPVMTSRQLDNLGHATAAFTLDVYGHVTQKMKQERANRMEQFFKAVNA